MQSKIKSLSLTFFDHELEKEFKEKREERFIGKLKLVLLIGVMGYLSLAIFDFFFNRSLFDSLMINRGLVVMSLLTLFGLSFTEFIKKNYLLTIFLSFCIVFGNSIHIMTFDISRISFLLVAIFFFTLIPFVTFRVVLLINAVAIVTFFFTLTNFTLISTSELGRYSVIFICGSIVSSLIFYEKHKTERLSFLKTKWSKVKNDKLSLDMVKLQNQAALARILQNSISVDFVLNDFLQQSLEIVLDLPWLDIVSKGSISLTNDVNDDIIMVASKDLGALTKTCAVLKPGQCLCGKAVQRKELLFNKCVTADHDIRPDGMTPHGHFNIPMMMNKKVYGVINLYVDHNHHKTQEEEEFLRLLANVITPVVYRYQLEKERVIQKQEIERAYNNINQSIEYAQRIQNSLLKNSSKCLQAFKDPFIIHSAKDIVSGDFYFARMKNDKIYVSVADCTGHGVPGSLVAALGIQQLEHIIMFNDLSVGEMITKLNENINNLLNNDNQIGSDGMDLILLSVDSKNKTIEYAGAKGIFYLYQNNELIQHKVDRMSIGEHYDDEHAIETKSINYSDGAIAYLLSDGFIDQISKESGKRIGSKQVKELFTKVSTLDHNDFKAEISNFMNLHIPPEQLDDITLISFKLC